jgi:hypothetical protein
VNAPPGVQQQQQPSGAGNQQPTGYPAMHPAAYSFYYPTPGLMPYGYQMIPMGSMPMPSATNPAAHGVTTSSAQYQKSTVYGTHAYAGQSQDYAKTFGATQTPNKAPIVTPVVGATASDLMAAATNAFSKTHVQSFDKAGFHGGTPPPYALPPGSQVGSLGAPPPGGMAYPFMPMAVQQQPPPHQSQSQLLHHAMPQDSVMTGGRGGQPTAAQPKVANNKVYGGAPYWTGN